MSDNKLSKEQEELVNEVLSTIFAVVSARLEINPKTIDFDLKTSELFSDNIFLFGHVLIDIHEEFDLLVEYQPLTEFDIFKNIQDVCDYFVTKVSNKRGLA